MNYQDLFARFGVTDTPARASLIGKPIAEAAAPTPADELIKQMVAPYVVAADDPDQALLLSAMDEAYQRPRDDPRRQ